MKIAAIVAHPDDAETYCGGTLIKYKKLGHEVEIIHATLGDKGYCNMPEARRKTLRVQEAQNAGRLTGIQVSCMGFGDAEVEYNHQSLATVQDAIRKADPDVIFTHPIDDYHMDHVALARLVIDATFTASVPLCVSAVAHISKVPQLYFMDCYGGIHFSPVDYVDISDTFAEKAAMLRCHESQVQWLQEHDNLDILEYIQVCAQYRGYQCGVKYAEGFVRYMAALRIRPSNLLP